MKYLIIDSLGSGFVDKKLPRKKKKAEKKRIAKICAGIYDIGIRRRCQPMGIREAIEAMLDKYKDGYAKGELWQIPANSSPGKSDIWGIHRMLAGGISREDMLKFLPPQPRSVYPRIAIDTIKNDE